MAFKKKSVPSEAEETNVTQETVQNTSEPSPNLPDPVQEDTQSTQESQALLFKDEEKDTSEKPIKTARELRKEEKKLRRKHHISNSLILKTYFKETQEKKKLYRYILGSRIAAKAWPIFRGFILLGLGFVVLYPIMYMLSTAFRPQDQISDPSVLWIPKELILTNVAEVWNAMNYPEVLGKTITVNLICSVLQVITCSITGYGFARFDFKFKKLLFGIVILQIIVPVQIILIPLFTQFRYFDIFGIVTMINGKPLNLIDSPIALYLQAFFGNGIRSGLFILLFRQFFRGLPKELEDAAYLDGCGPFQTFVRIMIPNAASSFLTVFIFSVVWYWNDSYVSNMFFSKTRNISMEIKNLFPTISSYLNGGMVVGTAADYVVWIEAGCLLSIIPILILYIFLQKHFVEGIERSGIVG